jgi:hypothetical protein
MIVVFLLLTALCQLHSDFGFGFAELTGVYPALRGLGSEGGFRTSDFGLPASYFRHSRHSNS